MAATIEFEDDALSPITSYGWGAIEDGVTLEYKFNAKNVGDQDVTGLLLYIERVTQNDGFDFPLMAPDVGGNPGTYTSSPLSPGTLVPNATYTFWIKVTVPVGTTPAGNPRQFNVRVDYRGT
jgi:hypothetical protein